MPKVIHEPTIHVERWSITDKVGILGFVTGQLDGWATKDTYRLGTLCPSEHLSIALI